MTESFDPRSADVPRFTEQARAWQGSTPLSFLERLNEQVQGQIDQSPSNLTVDWSLAGSTVPIVGGAGAKEVWVELKAQVPLPMQCQRCLQPVSLTVSLDRKFRFVGSESQAAALDEEAEDFDVLVSSRSFDFVELLEDELLMALPMSTTHEVCPSALATARQDLQPADSPSQSAFAALEALKRG